MIGFYYLYLLLFLLYVYVAYLSSSLLHVAACLYLWLISVHSGWVHYWADVDSFEGSASFLWGGVRSRQSGPRGVLIGTGQPNQFSWPECSNRALQEEALLGKGSETREDVLWDLWGCEACFTCPSRWENINSIKLQKIIVLAFLQHNHEEKPHSHLNPSRCSPNLVFYASVWLLECLI